MEGTVASVPPQGGRKHPQQEFLQVDTTNNLFICGGAFSGLEKIIKRPRQGVGDRFRIRGAQPRRAAHGAILHEVEPRICSFGLIPEFIGRLPVVANAGGSGRPALIEILSSPERAD